MTTVIYSAADIKAHVKLWSPAGFIVNRGAGSHNKLPPSAFGGCPVVFFEHPVSRNAKDVIRIYNDSAAMPAYPSWKQSGGCASKGPCRFCVTATLR